MVNIEQITSTLAKLPDQALQRYATMHKDDPYIMSLAVSESKRRKEMRSAGAAQPMQQQPKVADQALAEMTPPQQQMPGMPEHQGIGALPAAAQMNFADGGITGYADGGQVERYQSQGLVRPYETPFDRMNRETREREAAERAERVARIEAAGGNTSSYGEQMGNVGRFIDQYVPDPLNVLKTVIQAPGYEWGKDATPSAAKPALPSAAQAAPTYDASQNRAAINAAEQRIGQGQVPPAATDRRLADGATTPRTPSALSLIHI